MEVKYTLKDLEEKLSEDQFVRCHKSFLVNINRIGEIVPWFSGACILKMNDKKKTEIPVSRNYAREFKDKIGWT